MVFRNLLATGLLAAACLFGTVAQAAPANGEGRAVLNAVEHWYRVAGAEHGGTPLVIVHGGPGGSVYTFEHTVGPALERFTTVVYYDQRGSGRSAAPADPGAYGMDLVVSDLEELRRRLGVEKISLLGFSFGGEIVLEYALAHPGHVDRLVLQSTSVGDNRRLALFQAYGFRSLLSPDKRAELDALAAQPLASPVERMNGIWNLADGPTVDRFLFHKPEAAALNRKLWKESGAKNTGLMAKVMFARSRPTPLMDDLPKIKAPALVLVGLYDRNVGVDLERDVAAAIPGAELVVLPDSAHFPDIEEPDAYVAAVRRFLAAPAR
jgi:proline iminopeptidase